MAKSRKRIKNGYLNVQKAAHVKAAASNRARHEPTAGDTDTDNYEPPTKQPRKFQNNSSVCCREGTLQCDVCVCDRISLEANIDRCKTVFCKVPYFSDRPVTHSRNGLAQKQN